MSDSLNPQPRQPRGWVTANRLTASQRKEIERRYAEGETAWSLALEFGVKAYYIHSICPPRRAS